MSGRTDRRSLLARTGLLAGVLGGAGALVSEGARAATPSLPRVIHGADWRVTWPGVHPGKLPPAGTPSVPTGRLVDGAGHRLGTFEAAVMPSGGAGTHLHRLEFTDGAITAVGPATLDDATFAVIGGTGRFARASGSYHLAQRPAASGGTATFTLDITTQGV